MTIAERLYAIIQANEERVSALDAPETLTLYGLANAVNRRHGHISTELKRMRDSGKVTKVLRHIPGRGRRQYVYVSSRAFGTALKPSEHINATHLSAFVMTMNERLCALEKHAGLNTDKQ